MNHSIHTADRTTHLKIVVIALIAGISVAAFGISTRDNPGAATVQSEGVVKADKLQATAANPGRATVR